jgi:hypothetical protein
VNLATPDVDFPSALVKKARQRPDNERWVDRDGMAPVTSLLAGDRKAVEFARKLDASKQPRLRFAAELPLSA